MKLLFMLNIEFIPTDGFLAGKAMELAQKKDITYYDAIHVVLSRAHDARLVTQDKELLKKFKSAASIAVILAEIEN